MCPPPCARGAARTAGVPRGRVYGGACSSGAVARGVTLIRSATHSGEWRNWQTRRLQVPVSERMWGFKSPLAHPDRRVLRWYVLASWAEALWRGARRGRSRRSAAWGRWSSARSSRAPWRPVPVPRVERVSPSTPMPPPRTTSPPVRSSRAARTTAGASRGRTCDVTVDGDVDDSIQYPADYDLVLTGELDGVPGDESCVPELLTQADWDTDFPHVNAPPYSAMTESPARAPTS